MPTNNRIIKSAGSPEGFIEAARGTFYINTQSSSVYTKLRGDASTNVGWFGLICKGYYSGEGSPENNVIASKMACYLDTLNENLYVQLNNSPTPVSQGWVCVTNGNVVVLDANPSESGTEGNVGDVFINNTDATMFAMTTNGWTQLTTLDVNSSDILTNLSELLTNVVEVTDAYFNLFINPEPMDISVTQYDSNGELKTYTIPNRAKDRQVHLGTENPEGNLNYSLGSLYMNTATRTLYIKTTNADSTEGWKALIYEDKLIEPLYIDSETGKISIRTDYMPIEGSMNMVNSNDIYTALSAKADLSGNPEQNFRVAYPIENEDAINFEFIKSLFTYDSETDVVSLNSELLKTWYQE